MRSFELSLSSPAENLALDELLLSESSAGLERGEAVEKCEWLRWWECPTPFVVVGASGKLHEEVHLDACERDGVPVLRRVSGGGTVLQGPGCLNVSLVLGLESRPELRDVTASYEAILGVVASALEAEGVERVAGASDLAIDGLKVSGSAQKRTRAAILHHATLLYGLDLDLLARYLPSPPKEPDYRQRREHRDFCTNLPLGADELRRRVTAAWRATPATPPTLPPLEPLVRDRYENDEWTRRF